MEITKFQCLYCGGSKYLPIGHWMCCPDCCDPAFYKRASEMSQLWRLGRYAKEAVEHAKKYGKSAAKQADRRGEEY